MDYLKGSKGLASEAEYRYKGHDGKCKADMHAPVVAIQGYTVVSPNNDPNATQTALAN